MRARFLCRTGELAGADHEIGDEATIGRSPGNTLVLAAGVVSQTHARIFFDAAAGGYILEDLRSKNGTRLDGVPVRGRERLGGLHVVTFGEEHDFIFVVMPEPANATVDDRRASTGQGPPARPDSASETVYEPPSALRVPSFERQPAPPDDVAASPSDTVYEPPSALEVPSFEAPGSVDPDPNPDPDPGAATVLHPASPATARAVLEVTLADGSCSRVVLGEGGHDIGRGRDCAVWIDDRTLTRRHALLTVAADGVTIKDQGSRNGTFMDGARLTAPVRLRVGDVVTFGDQVTARLVEGTGHAE